MKKIKFLTFGIMFCFIAALGGCSLAVPEGEEGDGSGNIFPPDVKTEYDDSYAGVMVFVTDENYELINSDKMDDENCVAFALRYEAGVMEINGKPLGVVYQDVSGEDYFAEWNMFATIGNAEESRAEITVYINSARFEENWKYGICTLSYGENGEIEKGDYTYYSDGLSSGSTDFAVTQTITQSTTWNGATESTEKSLTLRVKLTVKVREAGTDRKILQYRADGSLIKITEVDETMAGDFILEDDCAYVLTEETFADGVKRTLYEEGDYGFGDAEFFYDKGFGLLKSAKYQLKYENTED